MFKIRNAESADYEMVKILEDAVFIIHQQARPDYFHSQAHYAKEEFEELLAHPAPIALVAVCDEQIVGICFGKMEQTTESSFCRSRKIAVIEDLFTLPEYRGRGIASSLLKKAREQAVVGNAETLELCVWDFNVDALRLYEKLGMHVQYHRMEVRLNDRTDLHKQKAYRIRKIEPSEYHKLEDFLYEAIFVPEGAAAPPREIIKKPELQVYISDFGKKKGDMGLVAEVDHRIIGAVWVRIMNDYGHIDDETPSFAISVYPEYRKCGIGTAMMREMLNMLKQQGYQQASLAVQKANYAVKMYENVGFQIVGENEEEYIMLCKLA